MKQFQVINENWISSGVATSQVLHRAIVLLISSVLYGDRFARSSVTEFQLVFQFGCEVHSVYWRFQPEGSSVKVEKLEVCFNFYDLESTNSMSKIFWPSVESFESKQDSLARRPRASKWLDFSLSNHLFARILSYCSNSNTMLVTPLHL